MRIVFMGSPDFAVPPLEDLVRNKFEVAAVYTKPDKPAGRGRAVEASPVKKAAENLGIAVYQPGSLKTPEAAAELRALKPDVIVVAAYGLILTTEVLNIPLRGCVNIHPSLLPKHRGASPVAAALLAGDQFTGVTVILMDAGVDTGPVLLRAQVPILAVDNTFSLTRRLSEVAGNLIQEALIYWERGEIDPRPQNEAEATYSPRITKEDGKLDWRLPAETLFRKVRAYQPWPGAYSYWQDKRLEILWAVPIPWESRLNEVGKVIDLAPVTGQKGAFGVIALPGTLSLCQVKLEGKKALPAAEFLRGHPNLIGSVLQ